TQSNAFDNLDTLLNLFQNNHLALTHIQIANEELGIISLRGSGTFGGIAQFLHDIQTLHNQYVSLDFIHIALKDTLEFELLIQDMRI
ncbi:MAG: hypothetical protein IJ950_02120, partial [Helicobacter sp.]|nr:hypothetical protein [Helicobacter sp.]